MKKRFCRYFFKATNYITNPRLNRHLQQFPTQMNQEFTSQELIRYCRYPELRRHSLSKDDLIKKLETVWENIRNQAFRFDIELKGANYSCTTLEDALLLRKLNDIIKRIYKTRQANRRIIIRQITTLLQENCSDIWILKTDISAFFESINVERQLDKFRNDGLLSFYALSLINTIFSNKIVSSRHGLPRGLSISSTMSELFMRKFDSWVRSNSCVYYYARYVDDIIIFCSDKNGLEKLREEIPNYLEHGLALNEEKTAAFNGSANRIGLFDFLGYKFSIEQSKASQNGSKHIMVSLADKKVKKLKTRIVKAVYNFTRNGDFSLLDMRIRFLTGNYKLNSIKSDGSLKVGIFFNYSQINDMKVFDALNLFLRKLFLCKTGSLGRKLNSLLTNAQRLQLIRHSFKHGFIYKVLHKFTPTEIETITSCWQ